jgi:hypothetical protein
MMIIGGSAVEPLAAGGGVVVGFGGTAGVGGFDDVADGALAERVGGVAGAGRSDSVVDVERSPSREDAARSRDELQPEPAVTTAVTTSSNEHVHRRRAFTIILPCTALRPAALGFRPV